MISAVLAALLALSGDVPSGSKPHSIQFNFDISYFKGNLSDVPLSKNIGNYILDKAG